MEKLMTTAELAEYLKVDKATIYRYLRENKIPALRAGGTWRFKKNDIDEWLTAQAEESSKPKEIDEEVVYNKIGYILL